MSAQKLLSGGLPFAFRRRFHPPPFQNVGNCAARQPFGAAVILFGNPLSMPSQQCLGRDDAGQFSEDSVPTLWPGLRGGGASRRSVASSGRPVARAAHGSPHARTRSSATAGGSSIRRRRSAGTGTNPGLAALVRSIIAGAFVRGKSG